MKMRREITADALSYIEAAQTFLIRSAAEHGLTETDLAGLTGLSLNTVKGALRKGSRPNSFTLGLIAGAIGVQIRQPKNGIDVRAPQARRA